MILLDHSCERHPPRPALQLAGHTHGAMILGLDRLVAHANCGVVSRRYDVAGMTLDVNNGTAFVHASRCISAARPS